MPAYFAGLIFALERLTAKTVKIGPLENFLLYGTPYKHTMSYMVGWDSPDWTVNLNKKRSIKFTSAY